jgi:hypothetical protein
LLLVVLYLHLIYKFNFPNSLEDHIFKTLVLGYLAYFILLVTVNLALYFLGSQFWELLQELKRFKSLLLRISTVFGIYILVDVVFGALYRLYSVHYPSAFDPTINNSTDALYFSTITIATVGYGDIKPISAGVKWIVMVEVVLGILLLAAILASAISVSLTPSEFESKNTKTANE